MSSMVRGAPANLYLLRDRQFVKRLYHIRKGERAAPQFGGNLR